MADTPGTPRGDLGGILKPVTECFESIAETVKSLNTIQALLVAAFIAMLAGTGLVLVGAIPGLSVFVTGVALANTTPALVSGGFLMALGVAILVGACLLDRKPLLSQSQPAAVVTQGAPTGRVRGATEITLGDSGQTATLRHVSFPHGTRDRDMWLAVKIDDRFYPQPVRVMPDGTLVGGSVQLGHDTDAGKVCEIGLYEANAKASEKLTQYFQTATEAWDWRGLRRSGWPQGAKPLFRVALVRA